MESESVTVPESVRDAIIDADSLPMNNQTTPEWLHTALAQSPKSYKLQWIESNNLPPIRIKQYCLNNHQVTQLLFALKQSSFDRPHAFVTALKRHCNPAVLDTFVWDLCDRWLQIGAEAKDKWALIAVGLLGTDTSVLKLARLIPAWRAGGYHQRAVLGLQCLRSIGTDTALMQINQIAQNRKLKVLQAKAKECMEAIAKNRGLTPEQLEDRIVPDCGLDAQGCRVFDYGSQQFNLVFADQMKPMVRDSEGKLRLNLPKPKANDDAELASSAMQAWNLLKKQLPEVIKTQSKRLERAMIEGRTWQRQKFESLLVRHPLMGNLVRSLIWAGYDNSGQLLVTFRVTEDQTCADADDESLDLAGVTHMGIVHPAQLSENLRATWGEVMSDYEIMAPFRQLSRTVFSLALFHHSYERIIE
jgi:hypothetical protein